MDNDFRYYTVLNKNLNKVKRNLYEENKTFSPLTFKNQGEKFDLFNIQYHEMFNTYYDDANGCDYERYGCKIERGDIVVDIGANIGMFSRRAYLYGASTIFSFEPLSLALSCLLDNKPPNCMICSFALSNKSGIEDIIIPDYNNNIGGAFLSSNIEIGRIPIIKETVITEKLDYFFDVGLFNKIDFLKIDCEFGEFKIIDGISSINLEKINKIAIEVHLPKINQDKVDLMINRLTLNGFKNMYNTDNEFLSIYHFWR